MDNFMDKLSKRFNAGELIQANGEAEAKEIERLKTQVAENEKILQEVRRIHLKTAEIEEQVTQMVASGIEQFEAMGQNINESISKLQDSGEENTAENENNLSEEFAGIVKNDVENAFNKTTSQVSDSKAAILKELSDVSYRLDASVSQLQDDVEAVKKNTSQDNAGMDDLKRVLNAKLSGVEDLLELVNKLAEQNQALEEKMKKQEQSLSEVKDLAMSLKKQNDEKTKQIEDYVHKENVKVYRNVQAAVNEQLSNKSRDINDHFAVVNTAVNKRKVSVMAILTFLLVLGGVAIQVLQVLGIL